MTLRNFSKRGPTGRASTTSLRRRRVLVEQLESRQLLAADADFVDSLPTAQEARFGAAIMTTEGREVCLAFSTVSSAEGEQPSEAPGPVDLVTTIVQPAGPLDPGADFTTEITFENTGPNDATATNLLVDFDANLTDITWEREVFRAQSATVAASSFNGSNGLAVQGIEAFDFSGFSVSGGGDFNGDGIDDFIVGANEPNIAPTPQDGDAYIVFGTASGFPANLSLGALNGTNGFSIVGNGAGSNAGTAVDNAGDVNGDGIQDILIGAPGADPGSVNDAGEAYVIFGSNSGFTAQVSTATLAATDGFTIGGMPEFSALGASVAGVGDINGDDIDDILVGSPGVTREILHPVQDPGVPGDETLTFAVGTAHVIFGKPQGQSFGTNVDVTTLTVSEGFAIETDENVNARLGITLDGAVDVNNDGFNDIILGSPADPAHVPNPDFDPNDPNDPDPPTILAGESRAHVIFGQGTPFPTSVKIADQNGVLLLDGSNGFSIFGGRANHLLGTDVGGLDDVNGDGFSDVIIAEGPDDALTAAPKSYVVFGGATPFAPTVDVATLNGTAGFVIDAPVATHTGIMSVSGGGDVNGDGEADLLIGLPSFQIGTATPTIIPGGGFVVYGNAAGFGSPLDLSTLDGTNGFLIEGMNVMESAGDSIGNAGDVNGDGLDDIILGAPFGSPGGNLLAGESYVYFGKGSTFTNGAGDVDETIDLFPGDRVVYRVAAKIAPGATGSTDVTGNAIVGPGVSDTDLTNNEVTETTLITTPPGVESIQINDGGDSRSQITSVTVTFDSIVDHGPLATAFTVTDIDTNTQVGTVDIGTPVDVGGKTIVTLTFSGASTVTRGPHPGDRGNSLIDGNYRLDIAAADVVSGGVAMLTDHVFGGHDSSVPDETNDDFFRLFGDASGDGVTNFTDLDNHFAPGFFATEGQPTYDVTLDGDGDAVINFTDLDNFFAPNFFKARI